MTTKSRPGSRTSRSTGEDAGTRDGAFGASLAGLERSGLDRRVKRASSWSTLSTSAMALAQSASLRMANYPALWDQWRKTSNDEGGGIGARCEEHIEMILV